MKKVRAKLIIWSLGISIQRDKLSNDWPRTDKVCMVIEVSLSIAFRAIYCTCTDGLSICLLLQQESNFIGCVFCSLHKL